MIKQVSLRAFLLALSAFILSGCVSAPSYDYAALRAAKPASILVLPPKNSSPDVNATAAVLSQLTFPLAETGYYVVPVSLMDTAFKENGVLNADDAQNISVDKLRKIFGADAALYTEITEFGSSYRIITSEVAVTVKARLVDLRSGALLWEGTARASSAEQQNSNSGGLAGLLIQAVVQQIASNVSDVSYTYAGIADNRLLLPRPAGLLNGPRSPMYGKLDKQ